MATIDASKVTVLYKPRCSWCGAVREVDELNGYDPLASIAERYKNAYCRRLSDCDSHEAKNILDDLVNKISSD